MARDYKAELKEAQSILEALLADFGALEVGIAKQKRIVAALAELADATEDCGPPVGLVTGVTDAVRTVLQGAEKPLNPAEIRDRVRAMGLPPQQNLLASVHTVLRRLLDADEIDHVGDPAFGGGYRWKVRFVKLADMASGFINYDKSPAPPKKRF